MEYQNQPEFADKVSRLLDSYSAHKDIIRIEVERPIRKTTVIDLLAKLQQLVFPGYFDEKRLKNESIEYYAGDLLEDVCYTLCKLIARALPIRRPPLPDEDIESESKRLAFAFSDKIPAIRELLATDVDAFFDGDPAAFSKDEIILSYPGLFAIMVNRLAHELFLMNIPLIPRMMTEYAHSLTGIDIHPGASIGHHFFIDHGTGIVVGETTAIGNHVKIYQGVTLGGLSTRGGQALFGVKRHPTIGDNVTIYSGASILGGGTVVGENVTIGANAFIITSIAANTRVSIKNMELTFKTDSATMRAELHQDDSWIYNI